MRWQVWTAHPEDDTNVCVKEFRTEDQAERYVEDQPESVDGVSNYQIIPVYE